MSAQLPLSHGLYGVHPFPLVASKLSVRSVPAPAWKRAPPAVHGGPSAPVCSELGFWLVVGSSCCSNQSPASRGTRARAHTGAHSPTHTRVSSLAAPHPRRRSSAGWGWGDVRTAVPRRAAGARCELPAWEAGGALGPPPLARSSLSSAPAATPFAWGGIASLQVN